LRHVHDAPGLTIEAVICKAECVLQSVRGH
jgi:hypothetical protein